MARLCRHRGMGSRARRRLYERWQRRHPELWDDLEHDLWDDPDLDHGLFKSNLWLIALWQALRALEARAVCAAQPPPPWPAPADEAPPFRPLARLSARRPRAPSAPAPGEARAA